MFNNTRVIPARIFGRKDSGGRIEILIERIIDSYRVQAYLRSSKSPKIGTELILDGEHSVSVIGRESELFILESDKNWIEIMDEVGHIPLPPYITREDELSDQERYQTVYSKESGAVAAPTAGLHFDQDILDELASKGIQLAELTLHVGAGTFQPVRVDDPLQHQMHSEWMAVEESLAKKVRKTKTNGG